MAIVTFVIAQVPIFCTTIYLHRTTTHCGLERFGLACVSQLPIAKAA